MQTATRNDSVLITGAFGQLGKRITQILLNRGRTVIALDLQNNSTTAVSQTLQPASGEQGTLIPAFVNLLDAEQLTALVAMHKPGVIVHLASIVSPPCYKNPGFARRVNVEGTRNLVEAAKHLPTAPFFAMASSSAVYGSRNPYRFPDRITPATHTNPVECYGEDKVAGEKIIAQSGLPHAMLRLGGIISPDSLSMSTGSEYFLLARATPGNNRVHMVDARDAALAFANAVDQGSSLNGRILLIGGNHSYVLRQRDVEDDMLETLGIGRLGAGASLPGDPNDDRGWGLTDWFDTAETQQLLDFQKQDWTQTRAWVAESLGARPQVMRVFSPILRPLLRGFLALQRRWEGRGPYADPWKLVSSKYGAHILAPSNFDSGGDR